MKVLKLLRVANLKAVKVMEKVGTVVQEILETSLLSRRRLILNWRNIFFYWLLSFLLVYHAEGQYKDSSWWDYAYYLWHSLLITFAILGFFQYEPAIIKTFYPILIYSIIRTCLYIIVLIMQVDMNARAVIETVFITALSATIFITINQKR